MEKEMEKIRLGLLLSHHPGVWLEGLSKITNAVLEDSAYRAKFEKDTPAYQSETFPLL
jgi:hypothetical protein